MMDKSKLSKAEKKIYTKPKLTEVKLVANEAVLDVCKNGNPLTELCLGVCSSTPHS